MWNLKVHIVLLWLFFIAIALFLAVFGIADFWTAEYNQKVEERAASIPSMACNREINTDCSEWSPPQVDTFADVTVPVFLKLIGFAIGIGIVWRIIWLWQILQAKRRQVSK